MAQGEGAKRAGRKRLPVDKARIAARFGRLVEVIPAKPNVQPLNAGFFQHERIRLGAQVKARGRVRAKIRGK